MRKDETKMKRKKGSEESTADGEKRLQEFKEECIRKLKAVLSGPVKKLKLSEECLFQLWKHDFASPEYAEQQFHRRLKEYKRSRALTEYKEGLKSVQYDSSKIDFRSSSPMFEYEKILDTAAEKCLAPLKSLDRPFGESEETYSVAKGFQDLKVQIISKTNPKKVDRGRLSEKQKEWLSTDGCGIETVQDVFEMMERHYLWACHHQYEGTYFCVNKWLKENHPRLHEFYLNGKGMIEANDKLAPSMRERLKSLDKLVHSKYTDPVMIERAIRQFKRLIEDDPLFACVFYSYFYKPERGRPPDLKRKALNRVKPYVYYLKFFQIQPIEHDGMPIKSIYDLGVLLLNDLAEEEIYSEDLIDLTDKGYSDRSGKLVGSKTLYDELSDFRHFWGTMAK